MANIVRRRGEGEELATRPMTQGRRDPFQTLRDILRWDPFQELGMAPLFQERAFIPMFEVKETPEAYMITADLAGVRDEDLDISVTGNRVTISGRREEEQRQDDETIYVYERSFGSFSRSFTLPEGADTDNIKAELTNGVLKLAIPKKPEVQPKKVQIKPSQPTGGGKSGQQPKA
jgi:HSP20 family protein